MTENGQKPTIERALEVAIYAPIGLAMFAKDFLPPLVDQFVQRGRSRVEELSSKVENQMGQARIIGQFAVSQGGTQIRREVGQRVHEARERGERLAGTLGILRDGDDAAAPEPKTAAHPAATSTVSASNGAPAGPAVTDLPIPDYDELSASQVVARLSGLEPEELDRVRDYETSRRQRKTILTKIDQLTS